MFDELKKLADSNRDIETIPMISIEEDKITEDETWADVLPILPLKNTVLFPGLVIPITVGRDRSLSAIKDAYADDQYIGVVSQKKIKTEHPDEEDLYRVGTVAKIVKVLNMPDGSTTAILRGRLRFELHEVVETKPYLKARISNKPEVQVEESLHFEALISNIKDKAKEIIELAPQIPSEAVLMLNNIESDAFLMNFISSNLNVEVEKKQEILEQDDATTKANLILDNVRNELKLMQVKNQIESRVKTDIEKQQRDYFLKQQLNTIQEELGTNPQKEKIQELQKRADEKKWPEYAKKTFEAELEKVKRINPQVAEYSVFLNYLEFVLDLPWDETTQDNFDLEKAKTQLDKDHFGLEKVKDRILEHLAVLKLKGDMKAPILCLVGPPGVGKTSLGKSIATAIDRKFVRMSLGGLHDESEIRGHRRTYIGAMPGRILQSLKKAGTSNPVFILDEIDKVGKDFRGDPSSALLEVLDPEQNSTFHDNYLDINYDLSKVLFIATANSLNTIQPALRDRMEIIQLNGYPTEDKIEIAKGYLIPELLKEHGLKKGDVRIGKKVLQHIIEDHTKEAGVRSLSRKIAAVMRHYAKKVAMGTEYDKTVKVDQLSDILGPVVFDRADYIKIDTPGVAIGLAWTQVGGDILFIESSLSDGKGKLILTGNLGDVMKESARTALSFLKANAKNFGIDPEKFAKTDIHIHVPEGAIPKDGPSAGITMLTALASVFTGKKVKQKTAMTGEITLRGQVLPVGGIKEKVLAARRSGIKQIVMSKKNERHVDEIKKDYLKGLEFFYVDRMEEVLKYNLA